MNYEKKLTCQRATKDLQAAYSCKKKLVEREEKDFLFALGSQWEDEELAVFERSKIKPVTDNRIQSNIFLLTGLERQNRSDFRAFPEGAEDEVKAEIASALFKHSIKTSDFGAKSSDQFKDGVTCGESYLELYLDNTENILNGKPCWKKLDGGMVLSDPASREYDLRDAKYVYKLSIGLCQDDLVALYPEKEKEIKELNGAKINFDIGGKSEKHVQPRDYGAKGGDTGGYGESEDITYDLIERYYKKWASHYFIADKKTGEVTEAKDKETAEKFISDYEISLQRDAGIYQQASIEAAMTGGRVPIKPPESNPDRFMVIERKVPEIWLFAYCPGMGEPLTDEKAWFYPKWDTYPFVPYFARFSTAPLKGDDRHLLVQGIVHGVKDAQVRHNKASTLMLRHLNTSANSGWLSEEDSWTNREEVRNFGSVPGISLEYKQGRQKPERIFPMPLSAGHAQLTQESAEDIKAQLGINADLLATQEGSSQSGRAIALRQKQGLIMVQELFDNLSRTRQIAGRFLLSQLGEIYDTETAKRVLGDSFLKKTFPPMMLLNEQTGQQEPMAGDDGKPMEYDADMAEVLIAEVLGGDLGEYDVNVGESVSSETVKMAQMNELKEFSTAYPGLIPPEIIIEQSMLPVATKEKILQSIKQAQAAQMAASAIPGGMANAPQGMA